MSREWVECIQWCSKHWIFIFRSENDHSDTLYPLNLAWSNSGQKSLNKPKIDRFGLFNPLKWACIVKIITIYVPDEFWDIRRQKVLIKIFFSFFTENPWFFKKNFQRPQKPPISAQKSNRMGSTCGFSSKLVDKTKNRFWEKCTGNVSNCTDMVS